MRKLTILVVLGLSPPSTMSLNFRRNLYDVEIESLQRLLISIGYVQLSSLTSNSRGWSLSPTGLFTVKSFYLALSMTPLITLFTQLNFYGVLKPF